MWLQWLNGNCRKIAIRVMIIWYKIMFGQIIFYVKRNSTSVLRFVALCNKIITAVLHCGRTAATISLLQGRVYLFSLSVQLSWVEGQQNEAMSVDVGLCFDWFYFDGEFSGRPLSTLLDTTVDGHNCFDWSSHMRIAFLGRALWTRIPSPSPPSDHHHHHDHHH